MEFYGKSIKRKNTPKIWREPPRGFISIFVCFESNYIVNMKLN